MTGALLSRVMLVVGLEYGQFCLSSGSSTGPDEEEAALDLALAGDGIGQVGGCLVICSPHQNNFRMPLTVEHWSGPPPDDLDEWQEVFEAGVDVDADGIVYSSPTLEPAHIDVPPGRYRLIIAAAGFEGFGWPGSTTPDDRWRVQLWLADDAVAPARLRGLAAGRDSAPEPPLPHEAVGLAAALAIGNDVDGGPGARVLSGALGRAEAEYVIPGRRRKLFTYFAYLEGWMGCAGGCQDLAVGNVQTTRCTDPGEDPRHAFMGNCQLRWTWQEFRSPAFVVMTWNWFRVTRIDEILRGAPPSDPVPVFDVESVLRIDLTQLASDVPEGRTLVKVVHDRIPVEWVDDIAALWSWQLERADRIFDFNGR